MDFIEFPDAFSCSFRGINSPIILRAEAGCDEGGMIVEEYRNARPNVHLYGETRAAREQFRLSLLSLRDYVESLETFGESRSDEISPYVSPTWFQIEIRQPDYRATLWGDERAYDFTWVCSENLFGHPCFSLDFRDAYERLKQLYETLFNAQLK